MRPLLIAEGSFFVLIQQDEDALISGRFYKTSIV